MNNNKFIAKFDDPEFIKEELFEATHALFSETSVRRIKFLQNRIDYLKKIAKKKLKG